MPERASDFFLLRPNYRRFYFPECVPIISMADFSSKLDLLRRFFFIFGPERIESVIWVLLSLQLPPAFLADSFDFLKRFLTKKLDLKKPRTHLELLLEQKTASRKKLEHEKSTNKRHMATDRIMSSDLINRVRLSIEEPSGGIKISSNPLFMKSRKCSSSQPFTETD